MTLSQVPSKLSLTVTALLALLIGRAFAWAQIDVSEADINTFLQVGAELVLIAAAYIGRVRKEDMHWFGLKK